MVRAHGEMCSNFCWKCNHAHNDGNDDNDDDNDEDDHGGNDDDADNDDDDDDDDSSDDNDGKDDDDNDVGQICGHIKAIFVYSGHTGHNCHKLSRMKAAFVVTK